MADFDRITEVNYLVPTGLVSIVFETDFSKLQTTFLGFIKKLI